MQPLHRGTLYAMLWVHICLTGPAPVLADTTAVIDSSRWRGSLMGAVIEQSHRGRFDSAFGLCEELQLAHPENPAGYFLSADIYQTMMRDYRTRIFEDQFDSLITISIALAEKALEQLPSAENYLLLGSAEGYRSVHWFRRGHILKAVRAALKSKSRLQQAVDLQPDFVDPLLGLALYDYAKCRLSWGLLGGEREAIISDLKTAKRDGRFVSCNAEYSLMMIYFQFGEFGHALAVNDT